jgi:hypothetical protein
MQGVTGTVQFAQFPGMTGTIYFNPADLRRMLDLPGPTGATGPTGPTGPTVVTRECLGSTGSTGSTGNRYVNVNYIINANTSGKVTAEITF